MSSVFMENATTRRTLGNIERALKKSLGRIRNKNYDGEDEKAINTISDEILRIHGLSDDRFDFISKMEDIITGHLNDSSIDANSNKCEKTVESIHHEIAAPIKKAVGYDLLYRMMVDLYGKEEAKRLSGHLYTYALCMHDSVNILKNYCWAFNASPLVYEGRNFGQLYSKPSKRLDSYISALCETIHQMASHLAGAIAISSLFLDAAHILIYKQEISIDNIRNNPLQRKYIENEFQQFVHSINHLSRSGSESPFTNISIFDKPKLRYLVKELDWYFPVLNNGKKEDHIEKIVDYIMELQKIFIEFFNEGDPSANGLPYRFPVISINLSKVNGDDTYKIVDGEFLDYICSKDIFRFNIFAGKDNKVASCCRLLSDSDMMDLGNQVNSFGGTGLSLGSHRVVTVNLNRVALESESEEDFFVLLNKRLNDTGKILKAHKELIIRLTNKGLQSFIKRGWINMNRMFSTFGILGLHECVNTLNKKYSPPEEIDLQEKILKAINEKVQVISKELSIFGNIEQVPGESMAIRLAKIDKLLFGCKEVPYVLYANQLVPLWENCSIWERMTLDGKYNRLFTGGGIVHVTIGEKLTSKQAEKIIRYAVKVGCEHFALNAIYCRCSSSNNGESHVSLGKLETCPVCGSKISEYLTRVVGMFTQVSQWEKERREWEFPKRVIETIHKDSSNNDKDNNESESIPEFLLTKDLIRSIQKANTTDKNYYVPLSETIGKLESLNV